MKKKNWTGIVTIGSFLALLVVLFIVNSQGEKVQAFYVKTAMTLTGLLIASAGIYLIDVFRKESAGWLKKLTWIFGIILVLVAYLVSFDILPFLTSWNWLLAFAILFVLLVQLQLLTWGNRVHQFVRFSTLFVILSDLFLVFFFIAKWKNYHFETWINLAAVLSIVFTCVGLIFLKEKKEVAANE